MKLDKVKKLLVSALCSQLFWIQVCAVGIWLLVFQNYFAVSDNAQCVYVVGGSIDYVSYVRDANVSGSVDVDNLVDVQIW